MATQRIGYDNDSETVIDGVADDITDLQNDIDNELNKILSDLRADPDDVEYSIRVYQVGKNHRETEYLFSAHPSDFPINDRLRDEYGQGSYVIVIRKGSRIHRKITIRIGPAPKKPAVEIMQNQTTELANVLMAGMERQAQMMREMMEKFSPQNMSQQPQQNPIESAMSMMTLMAKFNEIMGGGNKGGTSEIDLLLKGINMGREFALEGGEGDTGITGLAKTFLPQLMDLAKTSKENPQPTPQTANIQQPKLMPITPGSMRPVPTASKNTIKENPESNKQPENDEMLNPMTLALKRFLPMLISAAQGEKDTETYSNVVLDQVPEMYYSQFYDYINSPNCIDEISQYDPRVNTTYKGWFERLRCDMVGMLTDEPEGSKIEGNGPTNSDNAGDTTRPARDAGSVESNGTDGAKGEDAPNGS